MTITKALITKCEHT